MKNILKTFAIIFLLVTYSCKAQQMVQTPNDIYKLKTNEQLFLNKPLKNLLKEIKPEIKTAYGTLGYPSYFSFRFISPEEIKHKPSDSSILGLYVYVKEDVEEWSHGARPKEKEFLWTKEDIEKYGNFTVIRIRVSGKE
ncbi:hypothetical protein LPB87_17430 [Flavobacterium sp. EDS]|uniref:hypothetical protein n=1 Tax=Flavobacterium sp. EDS TaxID=2897328 RepID=UPI001E30BD56|nr:hypothetical protein [Flavobacterium sp. EDS]MCD0476178.1 hypothetical protein [Flavobacterium sp. EDS]